MELADSSSSQGEWPSSLAALNSFNPGPNSTHYQAKRETFLGRPSAPTPLEPQRQPTPTRVPGSLSRSPTPGSSSGVVLRPSVILLPGPLAPAPRSWKLLPVNPVIPSKLADPKPIPSSVLFQTSTSPTCPSFSHVRVFPDSWIKFSVTFRSLSQTGPPLTAPWPAPAPAPPRWSPLTAPLWHQNPPHASARAMVFG